MLKLFDYSDSGNGYKVRLLAALLGIPLEVTWVDITRGETRTPEFLAMNPNGKVPLLELPGNRYLPESNAMLLYLAEGTRFLPRDAWERALVHSWLFFEQYSHEPYVATARYIARHTPFDSPRRSELEARLAEGARALDILEARLASHPFLVGDEPSIADIALFAYTHVAPEAGISLTPLAAVRRWLEKIEALPGFVPLVTSA